MLSIGTAVQEIPQRTEEMTRPVSLVESVIVSLVALPSRLRETRAMRKAAEADRVRREQQRAWMVENGYKEHLALYLTLPENAEALNRWEDSEVVRLADELALISIQVKRFADQQLNRMKISLAVGKEDTLDSDTIRINTEVKARLNWEEQKAIEKFVEFWNHRSDRRSEGGRITLEDYLCMKAEELMRDVAAKRPLTVSLVH